MEIGFRIKCVNTLNMLQYQTELIAGACEKLTIGRCVTWLEDCRVIGQMIKKARA